MASGTRLFISKYCRSIGVTREGGELTRVLAYPRPSSRGLSSRCRFSRSIPRVPFLPSPSSFRAGRYGSNRFPRTAERRRNFFRRSSAVSIGPALAFPTAIASPCARGPARSRDCESVSRRPGRSAAPPGSQSRRHRRSRRSPRASGRAERPGSPRLSMPGGGKSCWRSIRSRGSAPGRSRSRSIFPSRPPGCGSPKFRSSRCPPISSRRSRGRPESRPRAHSRSPSLALRGNRCHVLPESIRARVRRRRNMALRKPEASAYSIRPAHAADLDEIARIERESFRIPWKREFFQSELSEPYRYARVLSAEEGVLPRIGGYLFAVSLYEEFHVNKIATDPLVRNRGYGRLLIEDAIARAREIRAASVTLEVRVSNLPAREFYRSYGFRESFRRKSYYQDGEDAYALVLPLEHGRSQRG